MRGLEGSAATQTLGRRSGGKGRKSETHGILNPQELNPGPPA